MSNTAMRPAKSIAYRILRGAVITLFMLAVAVAIYPLIEPPGGKWGGLMVIAYMMASAACAALGAIGILILWFLRRRARRQTDQ